MTTVEILEQAEINTKARRNELAIQWFIDLMRLLKTHLDSDDPKYEENRSLCDFWITKIETGEIVLNWK